jgi:hypothetical protein
MTGKKGSRALPFFFGVVKSKHMGFNLAEMFRQANSNVRAGAHG